MKLGPRESDRKDAAKMDELENTLPAPLKAAYDGLEVEF